VADVPFTPLPIDGPWAIGVSGGADSVALLRLTSARGVAVHAVHLDHETRDGGSTADAAFVTDLCAELRVPLTVVKRSELEGECAALPDNASARFRRLRHELFRQACGRHGLAGVLLAHHADDQAETVLHRLLRSGGIAGVGGMRTDARVGGLRIVRPLLGARAEELRNYLRGLGQAWREDSTNASAEYLRGRLRHALADRPALVARLIELGDAMRELGDRVRDATPVLGESFGAAELAALPDVLADEAARRWLVTRGAPADDVSPAVVARLVAMARDAAAPRRRHFPGRVLVVRKKGVISRG